MDKRLAGISAAALLAAALGAAPASAATAAELALWRAAEQSASVADYRDYLDRYPAGDFAALAKDRLRGAAFPRALEAALTADPEGTEAALGLGEAERLSVEESLAGRGFYGGKIDGRFDETTRQAIRAWQVEFGFAATGYLAEADYSEITAAPHSGAVAQTDPIHSRANDAGGAAEIAAREGALGYDFDELREIEARLAFAGFEPGAVDGVIDRISRTAIRDYRESRGFATHGALDRPLVDRLVADTGGWRIGATALLSRGASD